MGQGYLERPLVLPEGVIRIDGGPKRPYFGGQVVPAGQAQLFINNPGENAFLLVPGAAYGVSEGWEIGAVWPLLISPSLDLQDFSLYGKRMLQDGTDLEVAAYAEVRVPIQSELELAGGVPVQARFRPDARIDTGGYLRLGLGDEARLALQIPVSVPFQVAPDWTVGPELGVELLDFESLQIPLGVLATYSINRGLRTLGDVLVRFAFVDLLEGADSLRLDFAFDFYLDS